MSDVYFKAKVMDVFQENLIDVKTGHFQEKITLEILV
jgi:hypothetical protein